MGIHGLTTYLRENTRSLSKTVRFPTGSGDVTPIVVDGWSFIYSLYQGSRLPWVYGGEYPEFSRLTVQVVETWIQLGLKVYFVFDGACPELKFPTAITRVVKSHIKPGLLFFRTSASSRASPRFLHESRILPPLVYTTCVRTLEDLARGNSALEIHYADEEGDPYSVELAGRVGGYVIGNDSDFVVLNAPGYLGYIPLDDMVWEAVLDQSALVDHNDDGDDDFQMVRKSKARKKETGTRQGLVPPKDAYELHLVCTSYSPEVLASHLNLPQPLLPLLGALVGNDFTAHSESDQRSIQSLFFEHKLGAVQRLESAAAAIRSILSPTSPRKSSKHQVGSVMDLIDRTVNLLLSRLNNPLASGEIETVVDKVVMATLQYAIAKHESDVGLWSTDICALHDPALCPFLPLVSRRVLEENEGVEGQTPALIQSAEIRTQFVRAYRSGDLSPKLMDILSTGTSWPRLFLEAPDLETVSCSITRPLRLWIYSLLDDSLGLPVVDEPNELVLSGQSSVQEVSIAEEEDEDELIDVVESESEDDNPDFLAPLKGALQRLHSSDDTETETDAPVSVVSQRSNRVGRPRVTEYVRRGTRVALEMVPVITLDELLSSISRLDVEPDSNEVISLAQKPPEERITVFLRILESDLPSVRKLPADQLQLVLTIRWIAHALHDRALRAGTKEKEKEKWTAHEARCCLAAFALCPSESSSSGFPSVADRNVQLSAQLLATLETVEHLSQALLLTSFAPSIARRFSGRLFHSYLCGELILPGGGILLEAWTACQDGLAGVYREEPGKREKKTRRNKDSTTALTPQMKRGGSRGGFSLLVGLED